jgi:hypothetical protein
LPGDRLCKQATSSPVHQLFDQAFNQGKLENGQPGPPPGPNLTLIVPQWMEEEFIIFFNTDTLPGGAKVPILTLKSGFSEPKMPWQMVRAATTDDELRTMYLYLHSLPALDNTSQ